MKWRILILINVVGAGALLIGLLWGQWFEPAPDIVKVGPTNTITFTLALPIETNTPVFTPTFKPTGTPVPDEITDTKGIIMRLVPAGTFMMGSNNGGEDEKPIHEVELAAFYMDIYEVTNAAYRSCVEDGKCELPGINDHFSDYNKPTFANHPVVLVNWNMAKTYCEWRGRGAKLPSEAEWEKAARGTDGRTYPWGEDISCDKANYLYGCGNRGTMSVGSYESGKSPYGIHDMEGNVWEWVSSLYQHYPYDANDGREDLSSSDARVLRGGSWAGSDDYVIRSADRGGVAPDVSFFVFGFRCARGISP